MKREALTINETKEQLNRLQTLSQITNRAQLAATLGMTYDSKRDVYEALGYAKRLVYKDYLAKYIRQDIAKAVIDRPIHVTWQGDLLIQESGDAKETALETGFNDLNELHQLKSKFIRADKLAGIGTYSVLLLGLSDVTKQEDFQKPVSKNGLRLLYVRPFGESTATISEYETDGSNPRYGLPLMYQITITETPNGIAQGTTVSASSKAVKVHHTRIIHIVDELLESDVHGTPRLEVIYNRLEDLEKIVGGDAESFWRNARPGYQGKVDKDYQMSKESKEGLQDQLDEFEHNLRRMLVTEGVTYEALQQAMTDPSKHVDVQFQLISAVTNIPKRILTGSERGELASSQDADEWRAYVQGRRDDHATPHIVKPFVDRMIEYKILPEPSTGKYSVIWSDLFAMSEKDLIEVGKNRSTALKDYISTPMAAAVIPPQAFLQYFLGLDDDQIEAINELIEIDAKDPDSIFNQMDQAEEVEPVAVEKKPKEPMTRTKAPVKTV